MLPTLLQPFKVVDEKGNPLPEAGSQKSVNYIINQILTKPVSKYNDLFWLLESETGSGKSTVFTAELFKRVIDDNIIVTQPRVFNTISIPHDISKYNKTLVIGENIGYSTSKGKMRVKRGMNFVTVDTLLYELKLKNEEEFISKYQYIIIDEVHVRNVGLDILLFKLKHLCKKYFSTDQVPKVILMSATFDIKKFSLYFQTKNIIRVTGKSFPIEKHFSELSVIEQIEKIDKENPNDGELRDILVFIESGSTGTQLIKKLPDKYMPVLITAETMSKESPKLDIKTNKRRVIFGTNAVETGVTINTLKYVIELGYHFSAEYYPNVDVYALTKKRVTQGMSIQRVGRAGRLAPGVAFRMYSKETYESFLQNQYPDVLIDNIDDLVLYLYDIDISHIRDLNDVKPVELDLNPDMLDPISSESLVRSIENMQVLGYIDEDLHLTKTGIVLSKLDRISIQSRKMIWSGFAWEVFIEDLIIIAVMISDNKIVNKKSRFREFYKYDDFISLYLLYQNFKNALKKHKTEKYCEKYMINYRKMIEAIALVNQLKQTFKTFGININNTIVPEDRFSDNEYIRRVKICIYEGFKTNLAIFDRYVYRTKNKKKINITIENNPKYVVYDKAMFMGRLSAQYCSMISTYINVDENF